MKVVIDIPNYEFDKDIADKFQDYFSRVKVDISNGNLCGNYELEITEMFLAVFKRLKVLPKGHGRLIDANYKVSSDGRTVNSVCGYLAPTIVEADNAESEDN